MPFLISYRSIIPEKEECTSYSSQFCLSASHIAFGSIRMEPSLWSWGNHAGLALQCNNCRYGYWRKCECSRCRCCGDAKEPDENPLSERLYLEVLIDNEDKTKSALRANGKRDALPPTNRYNKDYLINASRETEGQSVIFFSQTSMFRRIQNIRLYSWASWIMKPTHSKSITRRRRRFLSPLLPGKMIGCTRDVSFEER
jgi:hypothetical protein